ncbi:MAG: F0F1 ATP synthase subunit delta [Candidatus Sungbacteria bacterium]|nr:F0F1 ATP synthase subunit delta [Candidatus Sungbacteria bacterium]
MRYTTRQYAQALYDVLRHTTEEKRGEVIKRLYMVLSRQRILSSYERILQGTERIFLKENGIKKVVLETPLRASRDMKKEIQDILGKKILLQEKIDPDLLAGIRIRINDEMLIDASAKTQVMKLFK